ncbi:MAG: hypothetical protein H7833_05755 [Magnetococcus sp. DMHC-1]|nr:hypothetical protein [Magnetococcales bacterium]
MTVKTHYFPLGGGMDLITPPLAIVPGRLLTGCNYEPGPGGGYRRIEGFERFDGQTAPSATCYWILRYELGIAMVAKGDLVTGSLSGATGMALADGILESGSHANADAIGYLVLGDVVGTFESEETLEVMAQPVAVASGSQHERGIADEVKDALWLQEARSIARERIQPLPGSGVVRGVWLYSGTTYAFRDDAEGTQCLMYRSSPSGWQACNLGEILFFHGGTLAFAEGESLLGMTSGASATIKRILVTSGNWETDDAEGRLVLYDVLGTFADAEAIHSTMGAAFADGENFPQVLLPGGRFECVNHNFFGHAATRRMYGVNGVNPGFEWDGEVFTYILTGMLDDRPTHLAAHAKHLFFSFPGGSLQHSGIGEPLDWQVSIGAGEIALGDEITGMLATVGGVMAIFCRNATHALYGTSSADWRLDLLSGESGAIPWSIQDMGRPIYLDDRGLRQLSAVQEFGDFQAGTLSQEVQPWFAFRSGLVLAALRVRSKNQYRVFFSDNSGMLCTLVPGRPPAFVPVDYGLPVCCACSQEDESGQEKLFIGSDDGFVYQVDSGNSFDGGEVTAFLRLPFYHLGLPANRKRFRKALLEIDASPTTSIQILPTYSYGNPEIPTPLVQMFDIHGGGGTWNEAEWSEFIWDSQQVGTAEARIDGVGTNIGMSIISRSVEEQPHLIHGITLHFSPRGMVR